jgi:type II secretory pathway pseudopilin PulG
MGRSRRVAGLTLVEVMVFFAMVSIAMLGALSIYNRHITGGRLTEQRRMASLAAEEKLDEMRSAIADRLAKAPTGNALDYIFYHNAPAPHNLDYYGYDPDNVGPTVALGLNRPCCFDVPNLPPVPGIPSGVVTIITDETPDEAQFGWAYNGSALPPLFGVDLNGNRRYTDTTNLAPFPLDINGNGTTTDNLADRKFALMPVVITIQWMGPFGRERLDVFSILSADSGK